MFHMAYRYTHRWLLLYYTVAGHHSISWARPQTRRAVAKDQIMTGKRWDDGGHRWQWLDETRSFTESSYARNFFPFFSFMCPSDAKRTNKQTCIRERERRHVSTAIWFQFSRQHFGAATSQSAHDVTWRSSAVSAWISFPYLQDPDSKTNTHRDRTRQRFPEGASCILSTSRQKNQK